MNTENLINVLPSEIAASTDLTHSQKKVLGQLIVYSGLDEAKENDGWFYRSNDDLCNDVECDKKTLIAAVNRLYDYGYIDRRVGSRATGASEYKVLLDSTHSTNNSTNNSTHSTDAIELIASKLDEILTVLGGINSTLNSTNKLLETLVNSGIPLNSTYNSTPDTDTDIKSLNYSRTELIENVSNRDDEISSDEGMPTADNKKFSEQYSRIQRAVREVQTTDDQEYIEKLQRVMDDACEKARMYASEKQLPLIECRIDEFQKFASSEDSTAPEWVKELPTPLSLDTPSASLEIFFQSVQQGLADTEFNKRSRLAMVCMRKMKKEFVGPLSSAHNKDPEVIVYVLEDLFNKKTAKYLAA